MIQRVKFSGRKIEVFSGLWFLLLLLTYSSPAMTQSRVWSRVEVGKINQRSDWSGSFTQDKIAFFQLDRPGMASTLAYAPMENFEIVHQHRALGKTIDIPMPDGSMKTFQIVESPVMESELRLKYPAIKSFKGVNPENPAEIARFDMGPYGFHALISTQEGIVQIDPFNRQEPDYYVSYFTTDYSSDTYDSIPACGVDDEMESQMKRPLFGMQRFDHEPMLLRQYRLALACTPTWAQSRGTVENCLADMNTMVNRANLIFEKELSVRVVLIAKNDQIIFLDPLANPYTNTDQGRLLISQNTQVLNQRIGSPAYDLGHVLSRCFDVGGIASLGSICSQGKGAGVTCHNNNNLESVVTRVMSHEMGHQMSASHTFSSCGSTDQLALGTAFEPGSGTTIMSYAGACGSDNVAGNNDDYYHVGSLDQMLSYTNWVNQDAYVCANKIDISNTVPSATIYKEGGFYIPISTPFELTGEGMDMENDPMTYVWEQYDSGGAPFGSPTGNSPLFRSLRPGSKVTRFFPNESRILANRLTEKEELLPTYSRNMTFRFVVRDNNPMGGAANWDQIKFFATADAGPFKMKFPFFDEKFEVGQKINVLWEVANTNMPPVNCKKVNIFLSLNDALESNSPNLVPLALNVDNDGEELVILPNYVTNKARIVIKAADNIFLTTGIFPSVIGPATKPSFFMQVLDNQRDVCLPATVDFQFETEALGGLTDQINFEIASGLPADAIATFQASAIQGGEKNQLNIQLPNSIGSGVFEVVIRCHVPGVDTLERKLYLNLTGTDLDFALPLTPENGITGAAQVQNYRWVSKHDAVQYHFQLATNPSFTQSVVVMERELNDTFLNSNFIMDKSAIYYWRVRAVNHCRNGEWSEIFALNTEASSCFTASSGPLSVNISGSGTPTIEGSLFVAQDNQIVDLNIKKIRGDHERVGDLDVYLVSPKNTELLLWSKKCSTSKGFYIGLDDQSIEFFKCPINTGKIYKPDLKLDKFNGESSKGIWKVRVEDKVPGEGGRLHEFDLEICTNITLEPPVLVNNQLLQVARLNKQKIQNVGLLTEDSNNPAGQLIYTIVKIPVYGVILKNNQVLEAGDQFTQADINNGIMEYLHTWSLETKDNFTFTVSDGEGGWIPITRFEILIDQSSSVDNTSFVGHLFLSPNPADQFVRVQLETNQGESSPLEIFDLHGRLVYKTMITKKIDIPLTSWLPGMYIVQVQAGQKILTKKLIIN